MISRQWAIKLLELQIRDLREHCDSKEKSLFASIYEHMHGQLIQGVSRDGLLDLLAKARLIIKDTPHVHMAAARDKALADMEQLLRDLDEESYADRFDAQTVQRFRCDAQVKTVTPIVTAYGRIEKGAIANIRAVLPTSNLVVASFIGAPGGLVTVPAHALSLLTL